MATTVQVYDRTFAKFSRPEIHPKISDILKDEPRGRLLDLPAGSGALSYRLHKEGFDVTACDICPENFEPDQIPIEHGDFSQGVPFEDDSFDFATFIEGPEHAENPAFAFREFARVLRPGGKLILSIPNYGKLEMRARSFLWGSPEKVVSQERLHNTFGGNTAMLHISPLNYAQIRFYLETAGFNVEPLRREPLKPRQYSLLPVYWMIKGMTTLAGQSGVDKYWADVANSREVLLGNSTLIMVATLREESNPAIKVAA